MPGVSRFDCYPSDFLNGVIGLTGDEIAAYTIIMMMQYDRGVPVIYVGREHELSVRSGLPKGRLSKAIVNLEIIGKLVRIDGALSIPRTEKELGKIVDRMRKNAENSFNGGEATKQKWEHLREISEKDSLKNSKKIRENLKNSLNHVSMENEDCDTLSNENNDPEGRPAIPSASQNIAPRGPPSSLPPSSLPPEERKKDSLGQNGATNGGANGSLSLAFGRFWEKWPNKVAKPAAKLAFKKVEHELEQILVGIDRYIAMKPADRAWMHPATFLNGRRWEDQPAVAVERDSASPFAPGTLWSRD